MSGPKLDGLFLRTLCYTGMRLGEAIAIRLRELNLKTQSIYLPETKNDEARPVYLPPVLVAALANHPRGLDRSSDERLFRFTSAAGCGQSSRRRSLRLASGCRGGRPAFGRRRLGRGSRVDGLCRRRGLCGQVYLHL